MTTMTKYSEQQLNNWTKPPSDSESAKLENAVSMVEDAVRKYDWRGNAITGDIRVCTKGSYRSNTNVRLDSDVDLYVLFAGHSYTITSNLDVSPTHNGGSGITCGKLRQHLQNALVAKFGASSLDTAGSKAIKVHSNSYRIDADVTPVVVAHHETGSLPEGTCFYDTKNNFYVNYPEQDYDNGVEKNLSTGKNYKWIVRILKNIRNDIGLETPSFLIESLLFNAPDYLYIDTILTPTTFAQKIRAIAEYTYPIIKENPSSLLEVNKVKLLFSSKQKWNQGQALTLIEAAYERV